MNKKIVSVSGLLAVTALLAFAACHKNGSSSSSSGSVAGAMGALNSLALSGSGNNSLAVKGFQPRTVPSCITPSGSIGSAPGGTCPGGATATKISGSIKETMNNCTANGYTENGAVTFSVGDANNTGAPIVVCMNGSTFVGMTGTFSIDSSSLTVTGNGVNLSGSVTINAAMSDTNNTLSGTISGTAFGQTIPSTSF